MPSQLPGRPSQNPQNEKNWPRAKTACSCFRDHHWQYARRSQVLSQFRRRRFLNPFAPRSPQAFPRRRFIQGPFFCNFPLFFASRCLCLLVCLLLFLCLFYVCCLCLFVCLLVCFCLGRIPKEFGELGGQAELGSKIKRNLRS